MRGVVSLLKPPFNEKTSGQIVSRLQALIRFLFGLAQLGGLLGLPVIQQGHDLILHLTGGIVLDEIVLQFRAIDNHLINLLLFFHQNAVDHIAVQLALLIQLAEPLGLG